MALGTHLGLVGAIPMGWVGCLPIGLGLGTLCPMGGGAGGLATPSGSEAVWVAGPGCLGVLPVGPCCLLWCCHGCCHVCGVVHLALGGFVGHSARKSSLHGSGVSRVHGSGFVCCVVDGGLASPVVAGCGGCVMCSLVASGGKVPVASGGCGTGRVGLLGCAYSS